MKSIAIAFCAVALAGCADNYQPATGSPASVTTLKADAHDCRHQASETYLFDQGHGVAVLGILAGGAVGGAVGGVVAGGSLSSSNKAPDPTLDQMIEACMAAKGYTGTSEN